MGAFLDKPKTEKSNEQGKDNDIEYALSSMQGWRVDMEDSHTAILSVPGLPQWSFFAVFDGHAGSKVAEYSSKHLLKIILSHKSFSNLVDGTAVESQELISKAVKDAFFEIDDTMRKNTDSEEGLDRSGSTSVCVLISPTTFYFINCGDSRSLLCRSGDVQFVTLDHKPSNPPERDRIQRAGGSVMLQRVNGSLAVSRALGDFEYKSVPDRGPTEQLVSPEPDVTAVSRNENEDQFLVLACDGIFDVSSNEELSNFISSRLVLTDDLTTICNEVVDMSLNKGSRDNMTLIILGFKAIPKPSNEAIVREQRLEEDLRAMVKAICDEEREIRGDCLEFNSMFETLVARSEKVSNLPPGAGIYAKRGFVESVFYQLNPPAKTSADSMTSTESAMSTPEDTQPSEPSSTDL